MDGTRLESLSGAVGNQGGGRVVLKIFPSGSGALLLARPEDVGANPCKDGNGPPGSTSNCRNRLVCQQRGKSPEKGNKKLTGACTCACPAGAESCVVGSNQHIRVLTAKDCKRRTGAGNITIRGALEDSGRSACTTDADCIRFTGPGSLILSADGNCFRANGSTTGCLPPAGNNRSATPRARSDMVAMTRR